LAVVKDIKVLPPEKYDKTILLMDKDFRRS
jgi:hypothetical protein